MHWSVVLRNQRHHAVGASEGSSWENCPLNLLRWNFTEDHLMVPHCPSVQHSHTVSAAFFLASRGCPVKPKSHIWGGITQSHGRRCALTSAHTCRLWLPATGNSVAPN